jgi:hypothetical protein
MGFEDIFSEPTFKNLTLQLPDIRKRSKHFSMCSLAVLFIIPLENFTLIFNITFETPKDVVNTLKNLNLFLYDLFRNS